MIKITSKKGGFRRCGIPHPKEPTEYPDDRFSGDEIEIIENEPMLVMEFIDDEEIIKTLLPKDMTVAALKELLDKLEVPYDAKAKKDELVELVMSNTGKPLEE